MKNISTLLIDLFKSGISVGFPDLVDPPCPVLPSPKFGDYQFNGAMPISGLLKVKWNESVTSTCINGTLETLI